MFIKSLIIGLLLLTLFSLSSWTAAQNQLPTPTQIPRAAQGTRALEWSPDGTLLAVAEPLGRITIQTVENDVVYTLLADETAVRDMSWSFDGTQLVSAGIGEALKIWSLSDGSLIREIATARGALGGFADEVSWQPTGDLILASGLDTIGVWNAADGSLVRTFGGVTLLDLQWDPTGTWFAFAATSGFGVLEFAQGLDGLTRFNYPVSSGNTRYSSVDWNGDGTRVVTAGGEEGSVRLWDPFTGEQLELLLQVADAMTTAVFLDDDSVAAATDTGQIYILNTESGEIEQTFQQQGEIRALSWNPQAGILAVGGLAADFSTASSEMNSLQAVESVENSGLLNLIQLSAGS